MTRQSRPLLRAAIAIHQRLQGNQPTTASVLLPTGLWQRCELLLRRMQRAQHLGWQLASERLKEDLRDSVELLLGELNMIATRLEPPPDASPTASVADIFADLAALQEEFEEVNFDLRNRWLSVTTEPIELEGVYLGPFEIRLEWSALTGGQLPSYRVIARDPNPAATNQGVTHPHVQDEAVCEGDARRPIRRALGQGRLLDFFAIVAGLLRTYNADSPFVSLADWYGVECADCGSTVGDEERWSCEKCGVYVCGDCYVSCPGCDEVYCNACVARCGRCDDASCSGCMKRCTDCRADFCSSCLDDNERCADCHERQTENSNENCAAEEPSTGRTVAQVQPDRLGEAAVPA